MPNDNLDVVCKRGVAGCNRINCTGSYHRVEELRAKNMVINRKRKEFYLTDSEHAELKAKLAALRKDT